jgi:glycosyltransferase involved in cell wall biosynthesis
MKYGKPVVACDSGGTPEVVKDGESGILANPGDYRSLANAMLKLSNDKSLRVKMGTAGRKTIEEKFSLPNLIESTMDFYFQAVGLK